MNSLFYTVYLAWSYNAMHYTKECVSFLYRKSMANRDKEYGDRFSAKFIKQICGQVSKGIYLQFC